MGQSQSIKSWLRTLVLALAAVCIAAPAAAQYPEKPVRVVVVFPPGGGADVSARIVFAHMSRLMGKQFVIDNRVGASGQIGSLIVAQSPADGYTIMVHSATHIANAVLYKKLPYDVRKDFIGVTTFARMVGMLAVHPSLPVKSINEFIALAKKRPGELAYGSGGSGSYTHMATALFASMAGVNMIHVPYKGGGPAVTSLASGETQAAVAQIASLFPHVKSKRVRLLGVTSDKRVAQFPDVPAIAEFVPGYDFTAWLGCFVPAGTPRAIIEELNAALAKTVADHHVAHMLMAQTLEPMHMTPEQFAALIESDFDKYTKIVKVSGARID